MWRKLLAAGTLVFSNCLFAQTPASETLLDEEQMNRCLRSGVVSAAGSITVRELRDACALLLENEPQANAIVEEAVTIPDTAAKAEEPRLLLNNRLTMEALNRSNRFVLTPHKRNFILPLSHKSANNTAPYLDTDSELKTLDHTEAEIQFSIKILLHDGLFNDNGHLYLGYTNHAFWQFYNRDISTPFRETNHQPELILSFTNDWQIRGFRNVLNEVILNHQSNGQSGVLSRSWNRIMLNSIFEKGKFVFAFNPWYRLPETDAEYPGDPRGDDNPDIEKYMGNFELNGAYQHNRDIFSIMLRNNLRSDNKGAIELGWSFPVSRRMPHVRGYVKYFNGYGQSLIDYNHRAEVLGLGVILTDLF